MKIRLIVWALLTIISACFVKLTFGADLEKVIKETDPKVVKIGIVTSKSEGVCSGSFISSTGIVLTCAQCFAHGDIKKVFIKTSDGRAFPAAPLLIDGERDLALVVPDGTGPFPYFRFGPEPEKGQQVISFGSPLGIQGVSTIGWVDKVVKQAKIILHSAFISPGNSGGPLVDMKGRLIGVNEAMIGYGTQIAQGMYVAIDIISVKEFLRTAEAR